MNNQPITLEEIKELEQIVFDLKAMQALLSEHTKRVEAIVKKYTMPKSEAARIKEEKRKQTEFNVQMALSVHLERREIARKKHRIKYLKENPEPGSEREINALETALRAIGKLK